MRSLVRRLTRTGADELKFRATERAWVGVEFARYKAGLERWYPERLGNCLGPSSADLDRAIEASRRRDWATADSTLQAHFLARPALFVVQPADRPRLSSIIRQEIPSSVDDAIQRAMPVVERRYALLGYHELSFDTDRGQPDWHVDPVHRGRAFQGFWAGVPYLDPRSGDHKIIWELNRHQHWLALGRAAWLTGDPRYPAAFARELGTWMAANPPLSGINWASMLELAFRALSWIWAIHLFAGFQPEPGTAPFVNLVVGLDRQLDHIARHLSFYFSPNTHLLGEALALYVAGRVLPELKSAARWERIGRDVLRGEMRRQVHPDGGHAELSTHYHRYALDFYLLALAIARRTGDPAGSDFAAVASSLASYCRAMADDLGRLPTIGDDDGGMLFPMCGRSPADASDSLALAAALLGRPELSVGDPPEEAFWMLGGSPGPGARQPAHAASSRLFPDTGYAVLRCPGSQAIMDVGRHGFLNGGHAHADALSLVLSVAGTPLLIDPGTATYTMDAAARDRFRSTSMHNTLVIDGRSQSLPDGPFHWRTRADARLALYRAAPEFDYVEASHDGYLPLRHRRAVLRLRDGLWLVADHVLGTAAHTAEAFWHFDPAWTSASRQSAALEHPAGLHAALATTAEVSQIVRGDADGVGWCAPVYGRVVPAATMRLSASGRAPASIVTAIATASTDVSLSIDAVPVLISHDDGWHRVGVTGCHEDVQFMALFATPGSGDDRMAAPRGSQRIAVREARLETDARIAVLRLTASGEPLSLDLIDATRATWSGSGPFAVAPRAAAADLHLDQTALRRLSHTVQARQAG